MIRFLKWIWQCFVSQTQKVSINDLPRELQTLVREYRHHSEQSIIQWTRQDGSVQDQAAYIRASDRFSERAGEIRAEAMQYCREHDIDFADVEELMNAK